MCASSAILKNGAQKLFSLNILTTDGSDDKNIYDTFIEDSILYHFAT